MINVIALGVGSTEMKAALVGADGIGGRITFQTLPLIVPAALGDTAGCLGAGLLAWDLLSVEVTA